ncbi:hypothetical protein BDR05DRAFT_949965 [Suillus weaverae]|nr:hypothetical protein BDR05DRAFT_949965 [Suillus weaverae]
MTSACVPFIIFFWRLFQTRPIRTSQADKQIVLATGPAISLCRTNDKFKYCRSVTQERWDILTFLTHNWFAEYAFHSPTDSHIGATHAHLILSLRRVAYLKRPAETADWWDSRSGQNAAEFREWGSNVCVDVKYPKQWHGMDVREDPVVVG